MLVHAIGELTADFGSLVQYFWQTMDLEAIEYFIKVADARSLSSASPRRSH
jgi:hypothetical protein